MAEPVTATVAIGVGLVTAAATLVGAAVTGTVGGTTLAYNVYKDKKQAKNNSNNQTTKPAEAASTYNSSLVYQPSASYQKSGGEQISFGPDGRFTAVGTSGSDWSCGTITYYAPSEQGGSNTKQMNGKSFFGKNAGPPPYRRNPRYICGESGNISR